MYIYIYIYTYKRTGLFLCTHFVTTLFNLKITNYTNDVFRKKLIMTTLLLLI